MNGYSFPAALFTGDGDMRILRRDGPLHPAAGGGTAMIAPPTGAKSYSVQVINQVTLAMLPIEVYQCNLAQTQFGPESTNKIKCKDSISGADVDGTVMPGPVTGDLVDFALDGVTPIYGIYALNKGTHTAAMWIDWWG
jgi:hypothetical protein